MSTEDQNKAVVTLHIGVDVDAFIEDMVSGTNHNEFMPGRKVELFNEKLDSLRNVDFVLTREEAEKLKGDPRIVDVRWGTKVENGIFIQPTVSETTRTYSKTAPLSSSHYNWAIPSCINTANPFSGSAITFDHAYTLTGKNVDVVIQDSGILTNHPEWLNLDGTASRFQNVDWPTISGLTGTYTQDVNHYTDPNGHGTHVAGTVAGRYYGWAKGANIYAITVVDNPAGFGVSASYNMIRAWHTLKAGARPTIVNMSWSYYATYENINGGVFRGTPWAGTNPVTAYGMLSTIYNRQGSSAPYTYIHPVRVASVEADITDCINAGVILVGAAGNEAHKVDVSGGQDYDNSYTSTVSGTVYYHRGSTPSAATGVTCVGSVKISEPEGKSLFSNTGPRLTVFAPGEAIQSAIPTGSTIETASGSSNYPGNSSFKITKINGTSMASPQVTGVVACMLEARPTYNQTTVNTWLTTTGTLNRLSDTGGTFTDVASLQGATNRFLRQPFSRSNVFEFSVGSTVPTVASPVTIDVTSNGAVSYQFSSTVGSGANATLTLVRGRKYVFNINSATHKFWIKAAPTLGTVNAYHGVTNNGTDSGTIYFIVPADAPSTLYYISEDAIAMQGTITVTD